MNRVRIVVSLITDSNDYSREQATAAQKAGQLVGADVQVLYASGDALNQSEQLLDAIHGRKVAKADGLIVHPAGTALAQVARAAATANIGWALLNRDADYISELRRITKAPIFGVTTNQKELGRIQGRQFAVLIPNGGNVLYIQGPSSSPGSQQRTEGMMETKPSNVQVRMLRSQWTEDSARSAVTSWLGLSTSHQVNFDLVACHNDNIAMGARQAFELYTQGAEKEKWMRTPFLGCDACTDTGQLWIRQGLLTASIVLPPTAGLAVELMAKALNGFAHPPERTLVDPHGLPTLEQLKQKRPVAAAHV